MICFDSNICADFESATSREWLETNGIGGFASGTISGANTRRYHGLLTAATKPPLGRVTMLSKLEETVWIGDKAYELSANQYPGNVHPKGYKFLKSFRLDPFPIWIYEVEGIEIEKSLFMAYGSNTTVVEYKTNNLKTGAKVKLAVRPMLSFADYHALQHSNQEFAKGYEASENVVKMRPYADMPPIYFSHNARSTDETGFWYNDFEYAIEKERGFDFQEDLLQPFALNFDLNEDAILIASTEQKPISEALGMRLAEIARREALIMQAEAKGDFEKRLALAADQFIVARGKGQTVIAGYHWFSDWGRDTMIALSGLTLTTNRAEIAKNILTEFSEHLSEGMLPNRFPDAGEIPEYNTVDATLWFFEAIRAYAEKTGDLGFVREQLYEKLANVIAWHVHGTRYNIRVEEDGLLYSGQPGVQLTWMDAKIGDWVVTPRQGKAVEIQALWYNALCIMAEFSEKFGDTADMRLYQAMAKRAKASFNEQFWNYEDECLFDVIDGEMKDASIRPNQIFAVSLPHTMLTIGKAQKIVAKVEAELLTPVGLRSLSPKDHAYCPIYIGSPLERDSAYHQGTVWTWPIGAFIDALRKVNPNGKKADKRVHEILSGLEKHLLDTGIGQISEIFDADPPHHARGCMAQAWSVSEVLRVLKN